MNYAKMNADGSCSVHEKRIIRLGTVTVANPTPAIMARLGYKPLTEEVPPAEYRGTLIPIFTEEEACIRLKYIRKEEEIH